MGEPNESRERVVSVPRGEEPARAAARDDDWGELLSDAWIVTDAHGIIDRANTAAATLLGKPKHFLVGRPITTFVRLEQRGAFRSLINQMQRIGRVDGWTALMRAADGAELEVEVTAGARYGRDQQVTALGWLLHTRSNAASGDPSRLEASFAPRRLAFLAQSSALFARSFDFESTLVTASRLAIPMLGDWSIVDLLEERGAVRRVHVSGADPTASTLVRELRACLPDLRNPEDAIARVMQTGVPLLLRAPTPEQLCGLGPVLRRASPVPATASAALVLPLIARGQVLGALTTFMLESGRTLTPADLALGEELANRAALAADNARLYAVAQRANEAKANFLAAMSHELRTPLTAIIGYTELLADGIVGPVSGAQSEQLARIRASGFHLLSLVEQILGYARLEAGRDHVHAESIDARAIVAEALTLVGPRAAESGVHLEVSQPEQPVRFESDPGKVRQILVNLLGNALKFTEHGSVGLELSSDGQRVTFVVWDTGIGIPAGEVEAIFDPFWQVEQRATRRHGGTGLGLSVVRRLCQLLGGSVSATSEIGVGSRFTVTLPLEPPRHPAPAPSCDAGDSGAEVS